MVPWVKALRREWRTKFFCICVNMDSEEHTGNRRCRKKKGETKFCYPRVDNNYRKRGGKKGILQSKFTDNVTNKTKTETWKAITKEVNAVGVASRTIYEVKRKWICVQLMHPITPGKPFLAKKPCLIIVFLSSSGQTMNICWRPTRACDTAVMHRETVSGFW